VFPTAVINKIPFSKLGSNILSTPKNVQFVNATDKRLSVTMPTSPIMSAKSPVEKESARLDRLKQVRMNAMSVAEKELSKMKD